MRIDPLGTPPPLPKPTAGTATSTGSAGSTSSASSANSTNASSALNDAGSFTPTDTLSALLAAVRQAPDVRSEAVQSATEKLASGELDTPEAAADTARAFASDLPAPPGK